MAYELIDISSWQHPGGAGIDWDKVKAAGVAGVIIKATQGVDYVNPYFAGDVAGAHAAGLLVGAYHYAEPAKNADPHAELNAFLRVAQVHDLELGAWLDWEDNGGQAWYSLAGWCETFLDGLAGQVPLSGLYANQSALGGTTGAPWSHKLWIADPSGTYAGDAWARQWGQTELDGIAGNVDRDELLAGRGLNPNGPEAPESSQPAPGGTAPAPEPAPEPPQAGEPAPSGTAVPEPTTGPQGGPETPREVTVNVPQLSQAAPGPKIVNEAVKAVQGILVAKFGLSVGQAGIDGRFGADTDSAVRELQTQHFGAGPRVDGIVGTDTWSLLVNGG